MTHYSLDVDPGGVRTASSRLRRAGAELESQASRVESTAAGWASGWRGDTATAATTEASGMATLLARGAGALEAATGALDRLAEAYEEALEVTVPSLERRREAALSARAAAVSAAHRAYSSGVAGAGPDDDDAVAAAGAARASALAGAAAEQTAALRQLDAEFEQIAEDLRARTRSAGAQLAADPPVPVSQLALVSYSLGGWAGGLLGMLAGNVDAASALAPLLPMSALVARLKDPPDELDELNALLDQARAAGLPPTQYVPALRAFWEKSALAAAGIDPNLWDPSLGADANRAIIETVYTYYGSLYLRDPDLQWAGMAAMIGPSFAGGFYDLATLRELPDRIPAPLRGALPPGVNLLSELSEFEIAYYERTLLDMQQEIFFDQAPPHQAYAQGGLAAVEEMHAAGLLGPKEIAAWRDIASGDPARVAAGSTRHLHREQWQTIANEYDDMRARFPTGPAVTWAMTFVGAPSIEGARSYPDVFPATVAVESPGPQRIPFTSWDNPAQVRTEIETPFPDGNISVDHQRWELIRRDTLPAFQELVSEHPEQVAAELARPVGERIDQWRLSARWDDILAQMADWDVRVRQ